jgi:hypothetical protein
MSSTETPKAKRGRAKKVVEPAIVVEEVPAEVDAEVTEVATEETNTIVAPAKKTRGGGKKSKKPAVVATVTPDGIIGSLMAEMRPLIAHIPISSTKAVAEAESISAPKYNPDVPAPYDNRDTLSFLNEERGESGPANLPQPTSVADARHFEAPYKSNLPTHYSERLMVQFQDSNRIQSIPERTDCYCFWCCHPFDSVPCVIPADIKESIWHVYGNFCSPECAVAYLFQERLDNNIQWERYAMLNSLYSKDAEIKAGASTGIRSAPRREVLRIFGGSMDIREFRAILHEKKLRIDVLTPPMVSIIQTMDTKPIDFYDQSLRNVFVPTEARRLNAPGAQGLRLRRSKPIAGKESTLEFVMKIPVQMPA